MKKIILLLLTTIMISCSPITFKNTLELKKGMSKIEAEKSIDQNGFSVDYNDGNIFDLSKSGLEIDGKVELVISKITFGSNNQKYMFAFYNDKLIYWGFPQEFARENDLFINQIGEIGAKIIKDKFM